MPVIPPLTPGPSSAELEVLRLNTSAFIAANPTTVTLIPRTQAKTGMGVEWVYGTPRPLQVVRMIPTAGSGAFAIAGNAPTGDGFQDKQTFQMLMVWDAAVDVYDFWADADGIRNEVTSLVPYNRYERRAEVTKLGTSG